MEQPYTFAELNIKQESIDQIKQLERHLSVEMGQEITLIAYTKESDTTGSSCRAGLND